MTHFALLTYLPWTVEHRLYQATVKWADGVIRLCAAYAKAEEDTERARAIIKAAPPIARDMAAMRFATERLLELLQAVDALAKGNTAQAEEFLVY